MKNEEQRLQLFLEHEQQSRTGETNTPFRFVGALGLYRDPNGPVYVRARGPIPAAQQPWARFLESFDPAQEPAHEEPCSYMSPESIPGYRPRRELMYVSKRLRADGDVYYLSDIAGDYLLTNEGMWIHLWEQLDDALIYGTPLYEAAPDLVWFITLPEAQAACDSLRAYNHHAKPFCINDPLFICPECPE